MKILNKRRISGITICFLLVGCAAGGALYNENNEKFAEGSTKSLIIIFRENQHVSGGACYKVYLDGQKTGVLANGGFLKIYVEPGRHAISLLDNKLNLPLQMEAGEKNYVKYSISKEELPPTAIGAETSVNFSKSTYFSTGVLYSYQFGLNYYLAHVTSEYAIGLLPQLKDSSSSYTCLNVV